MGGVCIWPLPLLRKTRSRHLVPAGMPRKSVGISLIWQISRRLHDGFQTWLLRWLFRERQRKQRSKSSTCLHRAAFQHRSTLKHLSELRQIQMQAWRTVVAMHCLGKTACNPQSHESASCVVAWGICLSGTRLFGARACCPVMRHGLGRCFGCGFGAWVGGACSAVCQKPALVAGPQEISGHKKGQNPKESYPFCVLPQVWETS